MSVARLELWQRTDNGCLGIYRWMVWTTGPIDSSGARWFETEEEARDYIAAMSKDSREGVA